MSRPVLPVTLVFCVAFLYWFVPGRPPERVRRRGRGGRLPYTRREAAWRLADLLIVVAIATVAAVWILQDDLADPGELTVFLAGMSGWMVGMTARDMLDHRRCRSDRRRAPRRPDGPEAGSSLHP